MDLDLKNMDYANIKTLKDVITFAAENYGGKPAVKWQNGITIEERSYFQLRSDVCKIATYLKELDLNKGHIAIIGDMSYEWIVSFYGISCSSAVVIPIDKQLSNEDITHLLRKSDADCLIYDTSHKSGLIEYLQKNIESLKFISIIESNEFPNVPDIIKSSENTDSHLSELEQDSLAAIVFTSGTTGTSKGVRLTHKNMCSGLIVSCHFAGKSDFSTTIPILPTYHMYEITTGIQSVIVIGCTICIGRGLKYITQSMKQYKPTLLILVPMIVEMMHKLIWAEAKKAGKEKKLKKLIVIAKLLNRLGIDLRRNLFKSVLDIFGGEILTIVCGGAPLSADLMEEFQCFGIQVNYGYGITECSPVVASNMPGHNKPGSVGVIVPFPYGMVKILNDEILVRGPIVTSGYYNDPKATEESFVNGWYRTGDLGYIDKNNNLYITGRIKNLIILDNGENVSSEELEAIFGEVPLVKEVVIHALNNKERLLLTATVYPDELYIKENSIMDVQGELEKEFFQINSNLPPYKRVQLIRLRNAEFEKTSSGKIKRHLICSEN
ncbi:AMP-binding protein [Clostridium sp. E02]|uniref:AMP-binding protein n=1 Tax=Clostridium sp. E02 TaxID=2487134 RepID=UPI0013DE7652|nr:AMP-binding protein [Clostridium sp. E02]